MDKKTSASVIGFVVLFFATTYTQSICMEKRFKAAYGVPGCPWCNKEKRDDVVFIPVNTSALKLLAPADPNFIAGILWMRTAYYFGDHALTDRQYPYLLYLLDLVTDLSPHWYFPYLFGATILPLEADAVKDGIYIIDKGIKYHPEKWRLYFFKGFYLYQYDIDKIKASELLLKASLMPQAPKYLARLAATIATKANKEKLAIYFLREALQNVNDPKQKKMLIQKMKEVMKHGKSGTKVK